jgi:hypothetical protein
VESVLFQQGLEGGRLHAVELAIAVAGSFHKGVAHLTHCLDGGSRILVHVGFHRPQLQSDVFLGIQVHKGACSKEQGKGNSYASFHGGVGFK